MNQWSNDFCILSLSSLLFSHLCDCVLLLNFPPPPGQPLGDLSDTIGIELTTDLPALADVQHRNVVRIATRTPTGLRTPTLQVFSAIDNLVKGAAGQAMQNANLMCGFAETAGLPQ